MSNATGRGGLEASETTKRSNAVAFQCAVAVLVIGAILVAAGAKAGDVTPRPVTPGVAQAANDQFLFGDITCNGSISSVDALVILRWSAGFRSTLPVPLVGTCPGPGGVGNTTQSGKFGDVDCDGAVNATDALKLLRYAASMAYQRPEGCPNIGDTVTR